MAALTVRMRSGSLGAVPQRVNLSVILAALVVLVPACVTPATEVIVALDTDAPPGSLRSLSVRVADGNTSPGAPRVLTDDGATPRLPATFGVVPGSGARDRTIAIEIEADFAATRAGDAPVHMRRSVRFRFVPNVTQRVPVFLSLVCGAPTTGCTSVPTSMCTRSIHCEDLHQTCGDDGSCIDPVVDPRALADASTNDVVCSMSQTRCLSRCVDVATDPSNCGACGVTCASGTLCTAGRCAVAGCPSGQTMCGASCTNTGTDAANCGACGNVCPVPTGGAANCVSGLCAAGCGPGQSVCNGRCVALDSDPSNCGACNNVCSAPNATSSCVGSSCTIASCAEGYADVDGSAANGCERRGLRLEDYSFHSRMIDTRAGATSPIHPGAPIAAGSIASFNAVDPSNIPLVASAFSGTVTVVNPQSAGYLAVYATGGSTPPDVSTINFVTGQIRSAGFLVPRGFSIFTNATTDVLVDVTASYDTPDHAMTNFYYYHPLPTPIRLVDTRSGTPWPGGSTQRVSIGGASVSGVTLPLETHAITGWITSVGAVAAGYATVFDSDRGRPDTSNLSFATGDIATGDFVSFTSGSSDVSVYVHQTTHVVFDVTGYFSNTRTDANGTGTYLYPLDAPIRVLDTRGGPAFASGSSLSSNMAQTFVGSGISYLGVTIPRGATALAGSATFLGRGVAGSLQWTASGWPVALDTAVNWLDTNPASDGYIAPLGADGSFTLFSNADGDILVDVSGYFAP